MVCTVATVDAKDCNAKDVRGFFGGWYLDGCTTLRYNKLGDAGATAMAEALKSGGGKDDKCGLCKLPFIIALIIIYIGLKLVGVAIHLAFGVISTVVHLAFAILNIAFVILSYVLTGTFVVVIFTVLIALSALETTFGG